jgi:hypothetical protein
MKEDAIQRIEKMLGFTEDDTESLRLLVVVDMMKAAMGITEQQVDLAYEQRIKKELQNLSDTFTNLLDGN